MSRYQAGHEVLLKAKFIGFSTFQTIGGVVTRTMRFPDTSVDVTNQDSDGNYRELVQGIGTDSMDFDGDGKFVSGVAMINIFQARRSKTPLEYQVIVPGLGKFEGRFVIGSLELTGTQATELNFRAQWRSSGPLAFFPITEIVAA